MKVVHICPSTGLQRLEKGIVAGQLNWLLN